MLIAVILAGAAVGVFWMLLHAVRLDGQMTERLNRLREDVERDRKQAEIIAQQRTPDDAIDRLDRGDF